MIDIKFLRENPEVVKENIRKKFQDEKLPLVDEVIELDAQSRTAQKEADDLRANRNKISKEIGKLMGQGKKEEAMAMKEQVNAVQVILEDPNESYAYAATLCRKKDRLGEVTAVESSASIYTGNDLVDGKLVYHNYPEHSDVRMTVKSTAAIDSKGMYILDGGYRISVGSVVYVRTPGYTGTSYCISINRTEK